jgi:ferric-dicitrate binding protein FerR (iron transport regulator)
VERTAFGATKQVLLPDSSRVVLNGNSSLRYAKEWERGNSREVWLEGEGFFSVVHTHNNQRFIVHASDDLDVEVLGTTFSVANRSAGVRVVLNTGEVLLNLYGRERDRSVTMRPGDLVQVDYKTGEMEKKRVNPAMYSAWTTNTLMFENITLREVASLLEETYGLHVIVADSSLYDLKVSGSTPIDKELDTFFIGLEETFDLIVSRKNNKVLIEKQPSRI